MKIRELVRYDDPILRQPSEKFDFNNPPIDPKELYTILAETMNKHNGLGLSAVQVGIPYRVFVIRSSPVLGVFNPHILDQTVEEDVAEEGCLSFPGIIVKVKRPKGIKVRYTTVLGEVETHTYAGMTARVFCHEMQHLDGELFTKYATNLELAIAMKRAQKKLKKTYLIGELR